MVMKTVATRPAIAMIELIFSIMVIGIVLLSVPMLIQAAKKSSFIAIQQEAINELASHLNIVLGYHWDENCTDNRFLDPILIVTNGNSDLNESNASGRRIGTPLSSKRSFVRSDGVKLFASSLGSDGNETSENDLDDFSGTSYHLALQSDVSGYKRAEDYIETGTDINISTSVKYGIDNPQTGSYRNSSSVTFPWPANAPANTTTNIKLVTVTLTDNSGNNELNKTIILKAFSCNIGAVDLEKRVF
jgi:hypothetical protein